MKKMKTGVLLSLLLLSGTCRAELSTIVAPGQSISEARARIALIQALLMVEGGRDEALSHLDVLLGKEPDAELLQEIADIKISLGRYPDGYAIYKELKKLPEESLAGRRVLWGDFHGAERVWRERLEKHPDDQDAALRLGAVLAGADRYDEARAVYGRLWFRPPHNPEAGLALAGVLMLERKFADAAELALQLERFPAQERCARILRGEALQSLGELASAENIFSGLAEEESAGADDRVRLGVVLLRRGAEEPASESFAAALEKNPRHIEALFRAAGKRTVDTDAFMREVFRDESAPERLADWAELYTMEGFRGRALECYEQALRVDPGYFPAAEGRAFMLAVTGEHGRAAELYGELLEYFPESRRLTVGLARALAWGREYEESLRVYDLLMKEHSYDLVLRREAARVAFWGQMFDDAMARYDEILTPGVDEQLFYALQPYAAEITPRLLPAMRNLSEQKEEPGREGFREWLDIIVEDDEISEDIADIVYGLYGRYEIQRAVFHEREYKRLQWQRRYARALNEVSRLIELTPGNQEAVFDRAQIACVQGLCDLARKDYELLLQIDPAHGIAAEALELASIDQRPGLRFGGSYWREQGRSRVSDLVRRTYSAGVEAPVYCRTRVFF